MRIFGAALALLAVALVSGGIAWAIASVIDAAPWPIAVLVVASVMVGVLWLAAGARRMDMQRTKVEAEARAERKP